MPNELPKPHMQVERTAPPVVENPTLPLMTGRAPRPRLIGGKHVLMATEPTADKGTRARMAPFTPTGRPTAQPKQHPPMQPPKPPTAQAAAAAKSEGYVRLHLQMADGELSLVGAKAVDGPLAPHGDLDGPLAWEAVLGDRRLAVGAIQDAGVRRAFPDPDGPPEQQGHHIEEAPSYDVVVRVLAGELSLSSLPRLAVRLYRVKEPVERTRVQPAPLAAQFERELRPIAELKGIKPDLLAPPLQEQLERALG
jgi:hypothetical protein